MPDPGLSEMLEAPEHQVRAILQRLCEDAQVKTDALKHFKTLLADQPNRIPKRKAEGELYVCVKCSAAFSEEDNTDGACRYHPGYMEVDDEGDFWADFWEPGDGIIDSEFSRKEFPEGFRWDCCEKLGDEPGCDVGKHEARPVRRNGVEYITKLEPVVIEDDEGGDAEKDFDSEEEDALDALEERDSDEEEEY